MKKNFGTKLLSFLLAVMLLAGTVPAVAMEAFAADVNEAGAEITEKVGDNAKEVYTSALSAVKNGTQKIKTAVSTKVSGDYEYQILDDGTAEITKYTGKDAELVIPSEVDGYKVAKIGTLAFYSKNTLTSAVIPNSVTTIGDRAFEYCSSLTEIVIPDSVTTIGDEAFRRCSSLKNINVDDNNVKYCSVEGVLFNKDKTTLLIYPEGKENPIYSIPDSVTTIGGSAFYWCKSLTEIVIPNSVTAIGDRAFYLCDSLTEIVIPNSVTTIGDYAFGNCGSLTEIVIPDSVTTIGDCAFSKCSSLTEIVIPNSVTTIGRSAFSNCSSLTEIVIPDSVKIIGDSAFYYCSSLTEVVIPYSVISIGNSAFYGCSILTYIVILRNNVDIYYNAFDRSGLKTIYGYPGSTAEAFAKSYGCEFIDIKNKPNGSEYQIELYSYLPTMVIGKDMTIGLAAQLINNGLEDPTKNDFAIGVSNKNIACVSNIEKKDDGTYFDITAKNNGETRLTLIERNTGTVYTTNIQVVDGILTFNSDALPKYYDGKFEYNGYISGMYIDEYLCNDISAEESQISFNVYNSTSVYGSVDVYDANGNIIHSEKIDRFGNNTVTGIADTLWSGYKLLEDIGKGELLTYKQDSYTKKTPISVKVPRGGHIEITNDPLYSYTCTMYNVTSLTIETLLFFSGAVSSLTEGKEVSDAAAKIIVENYVLTGALSEGFYKEFAKDIIKNAGKPILATGITDSIISMVEGTIATFKSADVDLVDVIAKAALKADVSVAEEALLQGMSTIGLILKEMFIFSQAVDITTFFITLMESKDMKAFSIYLNTLDGYLNDNGVTIGSTDGTDFLAQNNFVMRSRVMNNEELSEAAFDSLNDISSKYVVRDIYLVRDGKISQPGQSVQVSIPIPDEYNRDNCSVYCVKNDGTTEKISSEVVENNIVFATDHFSFYAVVDELIDTNPESITLSQTEATLKVGCKLTLTATVTPDNAFDKSVTWSSSNPDVAAVDENGNVVAKSAGTAVITATTANGLTAACEVTAGNIAAESIVLSQSGATLKVGGKFTLTATVAPDNAFDKSVTWSSSNPDVAAVDENGNVTAKKAGTAVITATTANGLTATCEVTVEAATLKIVSGGADTGDVFYVKLPSIWMQYKSHYTTLGFVLDSDAEIASVKWSYANWSTGNPEANIESPDSPVTVIRPNGRGIGARSTWITLTVTDVYGNVYQDTVKVRFYKWSWQVH